MKIASRNIVEQSDNGCEEITVKKNVRSIKKLKNNLVMVILKELLLNLYIQ
jgi:hypothetical protein